MRESCGRYPATGAWCASRCRQPTRTMDRDPPGLTVFIVDDDPAVRDSLSLLLSLRGYRTASFARSEDFLGACTGALFGCVLADIRMPGISGLDLQAALAGERTVVPVLIMTAHGDVSSARAAFKANAVDFLEKPFEDAQLLAGIEAAFARERSRYAALAESARREAMIADLSQREREVLALLARGMSHRDVARELDI